MFKKLTVLFLFVMTTIAFSSSPLPDVLTGVVKGTALANHNYTVQDSIVINVGDTLRISPGDTLKMANDPATGGAGWIHILGTFICEGTSTNRIVITTATKGAKSPGMWGGIVGDSCKYVSVKFANILWAGGNDKTGHAYRTFDIYSNYANTTQTVFTDNLVIGTVDDCIGLHGGNASVLRNVIKWCGAPDGDNINVKAGTVGEIAYNVIWASGGNGIKINASTSLPRITNMCVHNNTIVAGGWRRITELGYGILVDASARAQIYNNILGDMYSELEITKKADTNRTVYMNNLFFYSVDSLKGVTRYYPSDGVGKPKPSDILDVKASTLFDSYKPYFTNDWNALDGNNDYRILSTSAATGKGITPPTPTQTNYWSNPAFGNGTATLPGDANIGAFGVVSSTLQTVLTGSVKGTTLSNHNYVVQDSIVINVGDTLRVSPGDTLKMANDPATGGAGWIHILGTFICEGTASSRIVITTAANGLKSPGMWGGIVGDSCKYVSVKFANILWAGGNDKTGHAYRTFDIYSNYANTTQTVFTDNLVIGTVDDCIGLHGGNASVLRNVIKWCGAPDGDNINVKAGTVGEIAYNVIWASGGNGIKINASTSLPRLTNMCVHNNTIVAGGWRRVTELGYGILVDASARAQIYNNILGDMYAELEITKKADTLRTVYMNNLFFYSVDSLKGTARYYPNDGVGKPKTSDILDVKASALFKSYNPFFTNDWNALDGNNDYHILSTSAAAGKGITPPAPTQTNYWGNPAFSNGTATLPGDANIGALGVYSATAVKGLDSGIPTSYSLSQNYPNPFNPTTIIKYSIIKEAQVSLKVYDIVGREVANLVNQKQSAGSYNISFDASKIASGVYIYRIIAGDFVQSKKMILIK